MTTSAGNPFCCFVWLGLGLLVGLPWLIVSWSPPVEIGVVTFSGQTMGTFYKVRLAAQAPSSQWPPDTSAVRQQVRSRLAEINRLMSTYDSQSELSRFNASDSEGWFPVASETARVVAFALEIAELSDGAFDPTVGPAVNLWGFGPNKRRGKLPTDDAISQALERVGYQNISVRSEPPSLRKMNPDAYLDLSAIAKGYAVDQVAELLEAQGFGAAMVEIGGEVRTFGTKPNDIPWRIAIEKPRVPKIPPGTSEPFQQILELRKAAIATSGDYHNYFERDGVRYSHTIDPQTGRPVQHQLAVVTVHAETCMEADALATALLVMGVEPGYDWSEQHQVAALFQLRQGQEITTRATHRFKQLHGLPESNKERPEK